MDLGDEVWPRRLEPTKKEGGDRENGGWKKTKARVLMKHIL